MKLVLTTLSEICKYVCKKQAFRMPTVMGRDNEYVQRCYGTWITNNTYTCFSYGAHWPMFVYDAVTQRWVGNADHGSRTTNKYTRAVAHALDKAGVHDILWLSGEDVKRVSSRGISGLVAHKINNPGPSLKTYEGLHTHSNTHPHADACRQWGVPFKVA